MSTVIVRTNAGAWKEQDALLAGSPPPRMEKVVLYGSDAVLDFEEIKLIDYEIQGEVYSILSDNLKFDRLDSPTTIIEGHVPSSITGHITGIGIVLEDGTLWGYAPYRSESGGVNKTDGFGLTIRIVVSYTETGSLSINYSPFDTDEIIENLLLEFNERIATERRLVDELEESIDQANDDIRVLTGLTRTYDLESEKFLSYVACGGALFQGNSIWSASLAQDSTAFGGASFI